MKRLERHELMLAVIAEREGHEMAQAHESEKTMIELENYFEQHYKVFDPDVPFENVIECALEIMGESAFIQMLKKHDFSDVFEMLAMDGYVTNIEDFWVVSVQYPLPEIEEIHFLNDKFFTVSDGRIKTIGG